MGLPRLAQQTPFCLVNAIGAACIMFPAEHCHRQIIGSGHSNSIILGSIPKQRSQLMKCLCCSTGLYSTRQNHLLNDFGVWLCQSHRRQLLVLSSIDSTSRYWITACKPWMAWRLLRLCPWLGPHTLAGDVGDLPHASERAGQLALRSDQLELRIHRHQDLPQPHGTWERFWHSLETDILYLGGHAHLATQ